MGDGADQPLIKVTQAALGQLRNIAAAREEDIVGVRLAISGRNPAGFDHSMQFVLAGEEPEHAIVEQAADLKVFIDRESADEIKGSVVDFLPATGGFNIDNPNPPFTWDDPVAQRVQEVLTRQINPSVAQHAGWVMLLDVKDDTAYIQLGGGCVGCGLVDVTLKQGIEVAIKQAVPEIRAVVDQTDHASGTNPYYQAEKGAPHHQPSKGGPAPSSPFG